MLRISSQNSSKDQRILLSDPNWAFLTGHKDSIKEAYKNITAPEDFKLTPYDGIRNLVGNLDSSERKEFLENWKNRTHSFVEKMSKGPSNFFNLAALALHNSVNLGEIVWDHLPTIDINRANPHIERVALCDWQFNQLPAISNAHVKWDDVGSLISRLNKLKIPGFWNEPLLDAAIGYKAHLAENLSYKQIEDTLVVQILMAIHSGRYEQLLDCANTFDVITPTSREKVFKGFMERVQPKLAKALQYVLNTDEPRHFIKPGTVIGTFKPSTQMSNFVSNEMNTSITCDDKYIYMVLNEYGKGQFLKVGSGMRGTIPGKVYLSKNSNITYLGNLSIVWVDGKLILRSTNDKIGRLKIFSTETLELEREVRFFDHQIAQENKLQELNRNYPLVSDGKRLFAILTKFKKAEHVVKQEMMKYFDKAFSHQGERKANKKDQCPANVIRKSEILQAQLMETALYEVHLDSNQEVKVRSERDVKPEEAPLVAEMFDSFCGLYPMHTCYVALKIFNWQFDKAAEWLMQEGEQEATKKTINITRHALVAQSEITGESHKVGQQYLLNASILSPLHSQMLQSGLWTMTSVKDGKMELTLHCNSPQRGNCAKIFTITDQPSEQGIPYDPDHDVFVWQSQQLAEFNGNLNQGQPPPSRARPRGRGGMMRRGKKGGGPSQYYRGGRGRGSRYKSGNLFGEQSQNSAESEREHNDEEDMSEGGEEDEDEEGGPPQGRAFNHNPYLSPAKANQGEGVHHYLTTLKDLAKMDPFYQKIFEEYDKAIDQDLKERNKELKEGRLFERLALITAPMETVLAEEMDDQLCTTAYDHSNNFFFPMILNRGAIAVCPHYGLLGQAVEKSIMSYLPQALGADLVETVHSLFKDCPLLRLQSFQDLKLHIFIFGLIAESKRANMKNWHWDQWLLNYHVALQSDGNVGIPGPRPGCTLSDPEIKKIQGKLQKRKKQVQASNIRRALEEAGVKWVDQDTREKKAKEEQQQDEKQRKKKEEKVKRIQKQTEQVKAKLAIQGKQESAPVIEDISEDNESDEEEPEEPADQNLTIDQMIGDYDDQEFMDGLHKKGQVFLKQEYHKIMPFCLAGDSLTLELLMTFLEDNKRLGISGEREFKLALRSTTMNLLLYWARQSHHLIVTKQEGKPEVIEKLLKLLLEIVRGGNPEMELEKREKQLAWLIIFNGWDTFITSTDRTFEVLSLCLESDNFAECGSSLAWEKFYFNILGVGDLPFSSLSLLLTKWKTWPDSFFSLLPVNLFGIDFCSIKQPNRGSSEYEYSIEPDTQKDRFMAQMVMQRGFYNIEYPEETSEFSLKFYTTPSSKSVKRSSSSVTENNQSYHESVHAELIKQREAHNSRAEKLWEALTSKLIANPRNEGLWILTTHLLNRAFSLSTWTSIFNLELVTDLVKLVKALHEGIPFEKKSHFYTFLSISLSMLIGIAHLSKVEVLGFFLNILNPLIDIASSVLQDINALVIEHYHMIARRVGNTSRRPQVESDIELIKNWALFLHEGIDFSQERIFETIHPYPLGDSNQRELFEFPGALGINVEMDPRSRVQSSQDSISLDSSANHDNVNFQIDNNFQTTLNLGPRSASSLNSPIFTIGPRVNVDFYGRNPVNQVRNNPQEVRWGYKLFLRPLYGERVLLNDKMKSTSSAEQHRLETILELSRSFSRLIALIRDSTSLLVSGHGLDTLGKECSGDPLLESEVQKIKREEEEGVCHNQKHKDFLDWYLFKGGLIQNKSEEQCLTDLMSHLQRLRNEKIDQIEAKMRKLGEKRSSRRNDELKRLTLKKKRKTGSKKEKEKEEKEKEEAFNKEQEEREERFKRKVQKRRLLFKFSTDEASKREQVEKSFYRVLEGSDSLPHPNSKLRKFVDDILLHFDEQPGTSAKLGAILHILRVAHPYRQSMKVEQMLDTFNEDMKREWMKIETLALLSFMYHSSIDIDRLSQQCEDAQILDQQNPLKHISEEFKEDIKAIAGGLDKLLDWMIQRVRGEKEFQVFARDVIQWRNEYVESYLVEQQEKKEKEKQEKLTKEKKEREEQNKAALQEVKQKLKAEGKKMEEKKKEDAQEDEAKREELIEKKKSLVKKKPEIAVAKGAPRFQKKKSHRNFAKVKAGKKGSKAPDSSSIASSRAEETSQLSEVQSAISENPEEIDDSNLELVQGDYFTLRDRPLQELKEQIHNSVYSRFLEFYQGDIQKAVSLCKVVDADFDPENPNTSLSLVFKFCKRSVLHEVDGGGGSSLLNQGAGRLRRNVPAQEMDSILGSPYEVVAKQVMRRALFLLLLKPTSELEQQIESGLSKDDFTSLALTRGESLNVARLGSHQDDSPRSKLSFVSSQVQSSQKTLGPNQGIQSKISLNAQAACKFLCSQCDLRGLKQDFQQQRRRAALRRAGLEFNQATIELCKNTPFARRSTGLLSQRLRKSALQGVESSGIDMLIKINEVSLQIALTHMESVNSNFTPKFLEKLITKSKITHQLYMAVQPVLLEILTHICQVSLLFEDNFTKEFIFKLLNEASSSFEEIPLESDIDLDALILQKQVSVEASTDLQNDLLVRFNSSQLLQEHAVRLRQASVRRCSNFSNMMRVVGKFTTQLLDLHFLISQAQINIPSKLVNLLKYASLGLVDTLMGDSSWSCPKLNHLVQKSVLKHLEAALQQPLTEISNIQRIQDILLMLERFPQISPQVLPLLETIVLKSQAPLLIQHALHIATPQLKEKHIYEQLILRVGSCILPDIGGQLECLRDSMIRTRKHHVYLHINAPNSDNYSFLLSVLYHYEEECLKRDPGEYKATSLLLRSELYKPIKTVQDLRKRLPEKVKRKRPKLPPDQPPEPKKEPAPNKPAPRKRRTQELAQDYMHENPLQGLETLKGAFQEYTSLFMEPVFLHSDSEEEIKRKIDFFNWNERVINHIRQAQRIAALLTSCGVANFCDVSLRGASQPYSYFGQNAGLYAGNVALNQRVEPPRPLQYQEAVLIGNLIKQGYLEKLPRIASNPYFRHWRAENNFNTERATLNFNQQNLEWLYPLEAKLTVAQEEALQNSLQEFDEREQLKPRKISLAEPSVSVSLVDSDLHERLTSHLQHHINKDVNWIQNAPRVDLSKLDKKFEGAEGFHYLMSEQACWPESTALSTLLQKESTVRPSSSMLGQLSNPSTQFYSNSKLKDLDKKRFNGFSSEIKNLPIVSAQSNQQIIQGIVFHLKHKISQTEDTKSFFRTLISETLKMIARGGWLKCSLQQKQQALGILELVGGWYRTVFQGMNTTIHGKSYTVVSVKQGKVKVIGLEGEIEEFDQSALQDANDLSHLVEHGQVAESILACCEQSIHGADSLLLMLLLKIAGKLDWEGAQQEHAAKLVSLLITLSQNKSPLSSDIAELKLRTSWRRVIEKLSLESHYVTECLDQIKSPQTEETKEQAIYKPESSDDKENDSELKKPSELILGYALPESEYIKDMPRTMQNVTNEVGLRLLHYWEKTLIPRTVQYCSSFPIQVLTNSIAQVRVPLRMGDITNATESILILLDRKVPNGCIIPSFNHDWNALIAEELKVGSYALAQIVKPSTDFLDTDHPFLHKCLQQASTSTISVPVLLLKFDQKLQAAFCAITDHQTAQMYYVWIGCGSLYPMPQNDLPHISGVATSEILNNLTASIKELSGVYAQETLLRLFYASGIVDSSRLSLLNLIEKSVQIELADRTINGWLDDIEQSLPLRQKVATDSAKKEDKDLGSFANMNLLIERVQQQDLEQKQQKNSRTYLSNFKHHLVSKCSLEELETLGDWCLEQWENIKSAQSRRTLDLRELHEQQARTPEHNRYSTQKLIQLHSEDEIGAGVILVFQKDAYLSSNSKLSFYSDPQRVNLIYSVQASRTDKQLEPIVFDSGKVWCEYSPGSFALLTEVEQRNPRKSQLKCSVVVVPQSWPTCCWLTQNLTSALIYKCVSDKSAALCGLKLTKKLIGTLCGFYEKGFSPAQIVQLLFRLMTRLIHKVRYFKSLAGREDTEDPQEAVESMGLEPKWLIQVAKNINTLIKKNRSSLTPPLIQQGVELLVTALVSPFQTAQIKYSQLQEAKLYPWLRASLDVASFLHNLSGSKKPEPMPTHIEEEVLTSLFLDSSDIFKNVFYFAQTEAKQEEKKEEAKKEGEENEKPENADKAEKGEKVEEEVKGPLITIKLNQEQIREAVKGAVKNGHGKMLNTRADIALQSQENSDEGVLFLNGWDVFYDEDEEGPDVIEGDSDAEDGEGKKEEEAPPPEEDQEGWSCPQCTFINPMEELVCIICGQGMRPAVQPHQEVVEQDPNAEEDLTLTNDVIDLEKKQKSRTKRRRKFFLEILEIALKGKVTELKNADLEKWNQAEDKRIKEVRDKLVELEKKRKEKEEQLREEQKKKAKQEQEQNPKKKTEEPKEEKPIEVPKSEEEKELESQLKRKPHPEYKEPQFIVRTFVDAKDKNFKFMNSILKKRLDLFVKQEGELTFKKIAQEIHDELKEVDLQKEKALPKLPEAPLAQGLGFTEWKQLKEMGVDILENSMEELIELDVSALFEFLVSMGYDFHFNKMHPLTTPPGILRFGSRKLQLLRHLVEDKMCRETKSVFGLRGCDFFLAGKSRGFDWETDPEPIGTYKDRLNTKMFTSLEKEDMLTLRYNWALLKNFNAKLESAISLIKIRSNSIVIENKFPGFEEVPLAFNIYINASRGICFSNIKRDLIQDAIYKTEVTVERRAKLEFERLKLAESLIKPVEGDQDALSSIQSKTQQVKLLPPNQIQRDVRMLAAILEDQEESKGGAVSGVKTTNLKLSREMSDWASSNISSKKISRSLSPSHKDSTSRLQQLREASKYELDDMSEDGSNKALEGVRDPFAELDQIVLQSQITHHETNALQLQASLAGESESKRQTSKSDSTMFAQAFNQVKKLDLSLLRAAKVKGTFAVSFDVKFRGEHVAGQGGPYRQFFADISAQLQPSSSQSVGTVEDNSDKKGAALSLLIPTPNNKSKQQDSKDKFIVNPRETNLEQFEFLGIMMGCCIRTGVHLTLNLPTLFWKLLTGEKILITDIEEVDDGFARQIRSIMQAESQEYLDAIYQDYTVKSVDCVTDIHIFNKAADQILKIEDKVKFIEEAIRQRFVEIEDQTNAIKRGIAKMVPVVLLSLTTCHELQILICGKTSVDIDLLERHTIYSGSLKNDSPRVLYFWETLRDMSEEDQLRFIKFCWGQERLPANDEEFFRARVRFMVKPALDGSHGDNALPKADTCFFNLQLPNYSSKEILKQKLLLAIYFDCDSMNAENAAVQDLNEPEAYEEEE